MNANKKNITNTQSNNMENDRIYTFKREPDGDLMTVEQLQARYGIGKNKAYSLVRVKGFPAFQLYGRFYIDRKRLLEWEKKAMDTHNRMGGDRLW